MILLAEKGRATVVLDKAEYKEKVLRMLSDGKTHEQLKNDPTASYKRKIVAILTRLKDEGKISDDLYFRLYLRRRRLLNYTAFLKSIKKTFLSDQ